MPGDPEVLKRVMKLRSEKKLTLKEAWAKVKKSLPKTKSTKEKKPAKEKKPTKEKKTKKPTKEKKPAKVKK